MPPPCRRGRSGCCTGAMSYLLQDEHGQVLEAHSISAGLDYPGVGPEHSFLKESGRAEYVAVTDDEALDAFQLLARTRGSCQPWRAPTPWPTPPSWRRPWAAIGL